MNKVVLFIASNIIKYKHGEKGDAGDGDFNDDECDGQDDSRQFCVHERR